MSPRKAKVPARSGTTQLGNYTTDQVVSHIDVFAGTFIVHFESGRTLNLSCTRTKGLRLQFGPQGHEQTENLGFKK